MPSAAAVSALDFAAEFGPSDRPVLVEQHPATSRVVRGRKAILAMQGRLLALAARSGQTGEASQLKYFLSTPDARRKTPWMVIIEEEQTGRGDTLVGAVLLFEYQTVLHGTRVFSTSDGTGRRNVLAAPAERPRVAAMAARALMKQGARIVHIAFNQEHHDGLSAEPGGAARWTAGRARKAIGDEVARVRHGKKVGLWAMHEQEMPLYLPLAVTYDQTLARIGQKTRANLRYYRKRCEAEFGCHFTAEVRIPLEDFLVFNRQCTYAVSDELATWRYRSLGENTFLCGIRERSGPAGEGAWLSLVGGRRQNGYAEIDWQMNRADLPASSLSTVVRAYLIEDEVRRGTTRLYIEGGTPHSIRQSFACERVFELTVKQQSTAVRLLERFASVVFPPKNYLAQMLLKHDLVWNRW